MPLVEFEWEQVTGYKDEISQDIMLLYKCSKAYSKQVQIAQAVKLSDRK